VQISETAQASETTSSSFVYIVFTSEDAQISDLISGKLVLTLSTSAAAVVSGSEVASVNFAGTIAEHAQGREAVSARGLFAVAFSDGVQITDEAVLRALWELINDSQSLNWQNIVSAGESVWGNISTAQATDWQLIQTPETSWGNINTAQPSTWVVIPTLKGDE
jgi:hypothetical protein